MSELALEPPSNSNLIVDEILSNQNLIDESKSSNTIVEEILSSQLQTPLDLVHTTNGNGNGDDISNLLDNQHLNQVCTQMFVHLFVCVPSFVCLSVSVGHVHVLGSKHI